MLFLFVVGGCSLLVVCLLVVLWSVVCYCDCFCLLLVSVVGVSFFVLFLVVSWSVVCYCDRYCDWYCYCDCYCCLFVGVCG